MHQTNLGKPKWTQYNPQVHCQVARLCWWAPTKLHSLGQNLAGGSRMKVPHESFQIPLHPKRWIKLFRVIWKALHKAGWCHDSGTVLQVLLKSAAQMMQWAKKAVASPTPAINCTLTSKLYTVHFFHQAPSNAEDSKLQGSKLQGSRLQHCSIISPSHTCQWLEVAVGGC